MNHVKSYLLLLLPGLLWGCAFIRSGDPNPPQEINPENIRISSELRPKGKGWPAGEWWRSYRNSQLNGLVAQALSGSPSLQVAMRRAEVVRAQAGLVKAAHGPFIGFNALVNEQRTSGEGFLSPYSMNVPLLGLDGPWYTGGTIGFLGDYELDIFGKNRAQLDAAIGAHNAAIAEQAGAELALATSVVQMFWEIQVLYEMEEILKEARDIEMLSVRAGESRHTKGMSSQTEAALAKGRVARLEEQIAATRGGVTALRENLKALIGPGRELPVIAKASLPSQEARMPARLGYELLARRPDLQAARHYIESSMSQVEAAKAAFYPNFNIMAFMGLDSIHLDRLFKADARQYNFLGGVTLPIFDSGRLNANLDVARAGNALSVAMYNEAVVSAVRDVASSAAHLNSLERQCAQHAASLAGLENAYNNVNAHHKRGLVDQTAVSQAKLPLLLERSRILQLRGQWIAAQIALIKSLGGGYQANG